MSLYRTIDIQKRGEHLKDAMREYTAKEMKLLKANPYTFKVTKSKRCYTVEFKEAFWTACQAGMAPRKILEDFGYLPVSQRFWMHIQNRCCHAGTMPLRKASLAI